MNPRRRTTEQTSVLFTKGPWSLGDSTVHTVFVHWLLLFSYYFTKSTHGLSSIWNAHTSSPYHKWSLSSEYFSRQCGEEPHWHCSPNCCAQLPPEPAGLLWESGITSDTSNDVCYPEIWATSCCNWLFKVSLAAAWRVELGNLRVLQWVLSCCHKTGLIEWELWNLRRRTQRTRTCKSHSNGTLNVLFFFCIEKEVGVPSK